MNDEQAAAFLRNPFAHAAIALRQWDDEAKIPGLSVPNAGYYLPTLRAAQRARELSIMREVPTSWRLPERPMFLPVVPGCSNIS